MCYGQTENTIMISESKGGFPYFLRGLYIKVVYGVEVLALMKNGSKQLFRNTTKSATGAERNCKMFDMFLTAMLVFGAVFTIVGIFFIMIAIMLEHIV